MNNKLNRRSFLRRAGTGAGIGALSVIIGTNVARAQINDRDTGTNADPRNRSGYSDRDSGRSEDWPGNGRGGTSGSTYCRSRSGVTDADSENAATVSDTGGCGRSLGRRTGITDSDWGSGGDPNGFGQGRRRPGVTDSDRGDTTGNGRGPRE